MSKKFCPLPDVNLPARNYLHDLAIRILRISDLSDTLFFLSRVLADEAYGAFRPESAERLKLLAPLSIIEVKKMLNFFHQRLIEITNRLGDSSS